MGIGTARDHAEALRWYRLAAENGNSDAQSNLGVIYAQGEGVVRDHAEAVRWYRLAA
jgi:TPR repeat protein